MYFSIVAFVSAIDVIKNIRLDHRVIQSRVKRRRLIIGSARNFDLAQLLIPRRFCIRSNLVKIPTGNLSFKILPRTFDGDVGDRDFDKNLSSFLEVENKPSSNRYLLDHLEDL